MVQSVTQLAEVEVKEALDLVRRASDRVRHLLAPRSDDTLARMIVHGLQLTLAHVDEVHLNLVRLNGNGKAGF